jgi:hypothetical protein
MYHHGVGQMRKRVLVVTDDDKLGIAASGVCVFVIALFSVLAYFDEAPKQIPVLLATAANVYFLRNASLGTANYTGLVLATLFFIIAVVMNIVM